ncbi:TRAP transporter substrate-binding protein (plasmid) [Haloferax prahovense]|uniref:TRAP transporter substrate-binding protein n=1 Tax=Haloferax prahovense TaxID=381852 RepID=UPI003C766EB1
MTSEQKPLSRTRRNTLKLIGAAGVGLAGCMGSGDSGGNSGDSGGGSNGSESTTEGDDSSSGDYNLTLRLGHVGSKDHVTIGVFAERLADRLEEETDGRLSVEVYPAGQLGDAQGIIQGVQEGSAHLGLVDHAAVATVTGYEPYSVFNAPYTVEEPEQMLKATNPRENDMLAEMNEEAGEQVGLRAIGSIWLGKRHLTLDSEYTKPSDADGKIIRTTPADMWVSTIKGLGGKPESVAFGELPNALGTGTVNGQENPLENIVLGGLHKYQSHLMMTGHIAHAQVFIVNEETWQKLTPEDQEIFTTIADEESADTVERGEKQHQEALQTIKDEGSTEIITQDQMDMAAIKSSVEKQVNEDYSHLSEYLDRLREFE